MYFHYCFRFVSAYEGLSLEMANNSLAKWWGDYENYNTIEMEKNKIVQRKNEKKKSLSFEKTNNINKSLARLSKRKNRSRWMKVGMKRRTF